MKRAIRDYSKSCIYKLCCSDPSISEIYVGSTTNFNNRKRAHKDCCSLNNKKNNLPVHQFIRSNGGWENWVMTEIEKYPATDKRHLETRERYWIETLKSQLNKIIPTRTHKEYYQDNREVLLQKKKEYGDSHKPEKKEYDINRRETHKDVIKTNQSNWYEENKERLIDKSRQRYIENKEHLDRLSKLRYNANKVKCAEQGKQRYIKNKERLSENHDCECGSIYTTMGKIRHIKTIKHKFWQSTYDFIHS